MIQNSKFTSTLMSYKMVRFSNRIVEYNGRKWDWEGERERENENKWQMKANSYGIEYEKCFTFYIG